MVSSGERGGVGNLASSFEKGAKQSEEPPSAVSGIASRFEKASVEPEPAVSSKISSLASAFDTAGAATSPTPLSPSPVTAFRSGPRDAPAVEKPKQKSDEDAGSRFTAAASRFANAGDDTSAALPGEEEGKPTSMFKNAASAFAKKEKEMEEPAETKVSAFASRFENAEKLQESSVSKVQLRAQEMGEKAKSEGKEDAKKSSAILATVTAFEKGAGDDVGAVVEDGKQRKAVGDVVSAFGKSSLTDTEKGSDGVTKGSSVGAVLSAFENNAAGERGSGLKKEEANVKGRFEEATSLFEGDGKVGSEKNVDEDGKSGASRFADAAKLFGGSN